MSFPSIMIVSFDQMIVTCLISTLMMIMILLSNIDHITDHIHTRTQYEIIIGTPYFLFVLYIIMQNSFLSDSNNFDIKTFLLFYLCLLVGTGVFGYVRYYHAMLFDVILLLIFNILSILKLNDIIINNTTNNNKITINEYVLANFILIFVKSTLGNDTKKKDIQRQFVIHDKQEKIETDLKFNNHNKQQLELELQATDATNDDDNDDNDNDNDHYHESHNLANGVLPALLKSVSTDQESKQSSASQFESQLNHRVSKLKLNSSKSSRNINTPQHWKPQLQRGMLSVTLDDENENSTQVSILSKIGRAMTHHDQIEDDERNWPLPPLIENVTFSNSTKNKNKNKNIQNNKRLCPITELPDWHHVNKPWILNGFRINYTIKDAALSIFEWHNETINIWTELVPMTVFIVLILYFVSVYDFMWQDASWDEKLVTLSFWVFPLRPLTSAVCHTFYCVNENLYHKLWRLDFVSIIFFIGIFLLDFVYLMYYCQDWHTQVTLIICWFNVLIPSMYICFYTRNLKLKDAVIGLYIVVTGVYLLCLQIMLLLTNHYQYKAFPIKIMILWVGGPIILGVAIVFHVTQFPEKKINSNIIEKANEIQIYTNDNENENKRVEIVDSLINYVGGSHQIWHIFVNLFQFILFTGIFWFSEYRFTQNTCSAH